MTREPGLTVGRGLVRLACGTLVAALALASAIRVYRYQPASGWLVDLIVGLAAVSLALIAWRRSWATSTLALVVAGCWWVGTVWSPSLYWHRAAFVALVLCAPEIWPRSRCARLVLGAVALAALFPPVWGRNLAPIALSVAVLVAAVVEASARRSRRWLLPSALLMAAIAGAVVTEALGLSATQIVLAYDAALVGVLVAVGVLTRTPGRSTLTDLAVNLGREPVRDVASLMRLIRAEPGLDTDLRAAIEAAKRRESANMRVRTQLRAAVVDVTESRRRLVTVAVEERARLAEELAGSTVGTLQDLVGRAERAGMAPGLRRALLSLEAAVTGLRPVGLDEGVAVAVRGLPLVDELSVQLDLSESRCVDVVEDTLYAVAAEALSNLAKYAGPCQVAISFAVTDDRAELVITDDGAGGARRGVGSGLVSLADRVEALGGQFIIRSAGGVGTTITATVPLPGSAAGQAAAAALPAAAG